MATVAEKSGTCAGIIDDMAAAATGLSEWSDADTYVVNDQSDEQWHNNGRVIVNSTTGVHILMFVTDPTSEDYQEGHYGRRCGGVRIVMSSDWDGTSHVPASNHTVIDRDPFQSQVDNVNGGVFERFGNHGVSYNETRTNMGVWIGANNVQNYSSINSRTDMANADCQYFGSVGSNFLTVAGWAASMGGKGWAGCYAFGEMPAKFWDDGHDNWVAYHLAGERGISMQYEFLDFNVWSNGHFQDTLGDQPDESYSSIEEGDWGFINPNASDDTFFFRRPVVYDGRQKTTPVGYVDVIIPSLEGSGGAHGDTVTYDGKTYRIFEKKGSSDEQGFTHVGLRYE